MSHAFLRVFVSPNTILWMRHYERRLPHWDTVDQPLFVTFRLHGSLPAHRVFPPDSLASSGKAFVAMDRLLDRGRQRTVVPAPARTRGHGGGGLARWGAEIPPLPVTCLCRHAESRASSRYPQRWGYAMVGAIKRA